MPTIYDNPMFQLQPQGGPAPQPTSVNTFGPQGAFGPASTGPGMLPITNMEDQGAGGANTNLASGSIAPAATFSPTTNTFGPTGAFGQPSTGSGFSYISPRDQVANGMMRFKYRGVPHSQGLFGV